MIIDKSKFCVQHGVKASTLSGWMQRHWTKRHTLLCNWPHDDD